MTTYTGNQGLEYTSDEVHNFLEPPTTWVGYHPLGGGRFPGTTNIPHLNILRDNGKASNKQTMYFNPNTLTLDFSRGKDNGDVPDRSIISWKQLHLAVLQSVPITKQDRVEYNVFAKNIRAEIRDVSMGMIEAAYMDASTSSLAMVQSVLTTSGFRKLRSTLNDRATHLLLKMESISQEGEVDHSVLHESEMYREVFSELKQLYDFKYMVKADDLANQFMTNNNLIVRTPLNHKKRFANFITVIFRLKLTAMHKNSFMPMFTKYSSDKEGDANEARRVEMKCQNAEKTGYNVIYLSKTKAIVPPVKREAFYDVQPIMRKDEARHSLSTASLTSNAAVEKFKESLLRRGEQYFDRLQLCGDDDDEKKIDRKVFMDLVSSTDADYANMLNGIRIQSSSVEPTASATRNSYLEHRARNIQRDQERLVTLNLVDKDTAEKTIRDAWDLSGSMLSDDWCDFDTMSLWIDPKNSGVEGLQEKDLANSKRKASKSNKIHYGRQVSYFNKLIVGDGVTTDTAKRSNKKRKGDKQGTVHISKILISREYIDITSILQNLTDSLVIVLLLVTNGMSKKTNIDKRKDADDRMNAECETIVSEKFSVALNVFVCDECKAGDVKLNEVRDDWREKKVYYEALKKGPGTKQCMGLIDGIRCNKMIHIEIRMHGVAYVCRNGVCYREDDIDCENWMCFDCNLLKSGGGRNRSRRGG